MSARFMTVLAVIGAGALPAAAHATTVTKTFTYTGTEQRFRVPTGVDSVTVHAVGGQGGCTFALPGQGADVISTIPTDPGSTLYVEVGRNGSPDGTASFNGGGPGGANAPDVGASGGGASDVRELPATHTATLGSRDVVAGGGGGGGENNSTCGGDADGPARGASASGGAGGPGTTTAGGAGGTQGAGCTAGQSGSLGLGGAGGGGSGCPKEGGGGGGGLYGGGGGGGAPVSAGGGGGKSFSVTSGATFTNDSTGVPEVQVTYDVPQAQLDIFGPRVFGDVTVGTVSATQSIGIVNTGTAPLIINGAFIVNASLTPGDPPFFVSSSSCGGEIGTGGSCIVTVRFAPQAVGNSLASQIAIFSNDPFSPILVDLSGRGVAAPTVSGPTGPTGATGPSGLDGSAGGQGPTGSVGLTGPAGTSTGVAGTNGKDGAPGVVGPIGPTGPAGPTGAIGPVGTAGAGGAVGPIGPSGQVAVVTCRTVKRKHKKPKRKCTTKVVPGPVTVPGRRAL